jgi:carbonic anhydrase
MIPAQEALDRLIQGNRRFAADVHSEASLVTQAHHSELAANQEPFAIILGCSDSRVPAEIVFGQGIGDLFVIRVAGNIVAPSLIGSVEFAADQFGTRLVVVMGHSRCGAVTATIDDLQDRLGEHSRNVRSIVDRIRPAVEGLLDTDLRSNPEALLHEAVRDGLLVVGAQYSLETGTVDFFDGMPK